MFVFLQTILKLCGRQISVIGSKNLNSQGKLELCQFSKYFLFHYNCFCCSQELSDQFSPGGRRDTGGLTLRHGIANLLPSAVRSSVSSVSVSGSMMSPPMSPAKKNVKDPDKPKRPMNGFMLFAKKYRLELIQQHPGKDNRQELVSLIQTSQIQ